MHVHALEQIPGAVQEKTAYGLPVEVADADSLDIVVDCHIVYNDFGKNAVKVRGFGRPEAGIRNGRGGAIEHRRSVGRYAAARARLRDDRVGCVDHDRLDDAACRGGRSIIHCGPDPNGRACGSGCWGCYFLAVQRDGDIIGAYQPHVAAQTAIQIIIRVFSSIGPALDVARWNIQRVRTVEFYRQYVLSGAIYRRADIKAEAGESAGTVPADKRTVEINGRVLHGAFKLQKNFLRVGPGRKSECFPIPANARPS